MVLVPLVWPMPVGLDGLNSSPTASRAHDGLVYGYPGMCAWTGSSFRMLLTVLLCFRIRDSMIFRAHPS